MHRRAMSVGGLTNADTNASPSSVNGVTESKDALFSIGWHASYGAAPAASRLRTTASMTAGVRSTTGLSRPGAPDGRGGKKVLYETHDGSFVPQADYERQQAEDAQRQAEATKSRDVLRGLFSVVTIDDDAKHFDRLIAYLALKSRHLYRLLAALCAGVSLLLMLLFVLGGESVGEDFVTRLRVVPVSSSPATTTLAPPPPSVTGASTTAVPMTTAAASLDLLPLVSPFNGGVCTLSAARCVVLFAYTVVYKQINLFFLSASLLSVVLGLFPFAQEASQAAPHRARSKRLALLQRTASDHTADPHTRAAAAAQVAKLQVPDGRLIMLLRFFLNPVVLLAVANYATTVIVMSVEHDRRRPAEMVSMANGLFSRLQGGIIARAVANFLAVLIAVGTSTDPLPTAATA
jgi:hypothetical protein